MSHLLSRRLRIGACVSHLLLARIDSSLQPVCAPSLCRGVCDGVSERRVRRVASAERARELRLPVRRLLLQFGFLRGAFPEFFRERPACVVDGSEFVAHVREFSPGYYGLFLRA